MSAIPTVGETFGRYLIQDRLGLGGMGIVYLALDTRLNRRVALKVMAGQLAGDQVFLTRFHREAEILTQLDSPHIVTIFDHGEIDGVPYLAMQYVAGGDLGTLIERRGRLPLAQAVDVCAQIAGALHDAHGAGVIHRDVKTGNVLIRDTDAAQPFAYLCDFGIAQSGEPGLTNPGGVAGSWAYLSPERSRGEAASPASDIYAVGCVLYAAVTGQAPYTGSDVELALAHLKAPVPTLTGDDPVTARLNDVLQRALAKDPQRRYATAAELKDDLDAIARMPGTAGPYAGPAAPARSVTVVRPRGAGRRRRRLVVGGVAAAVALVAGVVLGLVIVTGGADAPDEAAVDGPPPISDPVSGDWDNDGLGDVRVTRMIWDDGNQPLPQQLLTSTGDSFADPVEDMGQMPWSYSGDVDGDGRLDQVVTDEIRDDKVLKVTLWISEEDGPGEPSIQRFTWNTDVSLGGSYALGDFTGDGLDDLLMTRHKQDDYMVMSVAASNGSGFEKPVEFGWRGGRKNTLDELTVGDFNGDGLADVLARADMEAPGARVRVLLSTGTGFKRQAPTRLEDASYGLTSYTAADVDGDGADELVHLIPVKFGKDGLGTALTVLEWANGSFGTPQTWAEADRAYDGLPYLEIADSDVDGDGDDDIVRSTGFSDETESTTLDVYTSTGTSFEAARTWAELPCAQGCTGESAVLVGPSW